MNKDEEIFDSLIEGGIIGAALGALLAKSKLDGAILGAMAGAAILATYKASEQAKETNLPILIEEDGNLYEIEPNGNKKFLKAIKKSTIKVNEHFKLK